MDTDMDLTTCPHCGAAKKVRLHSPEPGRQIRRLYCPCQWREPTRRWKERNPVKRRAHSLVQKAIKRGTLKPQVCEECGSDKVEAHHEDYSNPLHVRWLCKKHHLALHKEDRRKRVEQSENVVTPPFP